MVRTVFLDRDGVVNKLCYHQELEVRCAPFTVHQFKLLVVVHEEINYALMRSFNRLTVLGKTALMRSQNRR